MAEYDTRNRRKFSLRVHLIFVTKYRKLLLTGDVKDSLMRVIRDICNKRQWKIIACETDTDHMHILLSYDTTDCVSDMVKVLKQESTYRLWELFHDELSRHYWKKHVFWSDGYFACSVGDASTNTVRKYIEFQG